MKESVSMIKNGYNVLDYGIVGDGKINNTKAINNLCEMASNKGGVLYFPKGEYVTGTIFLYDNMTLTLEEGATILGSENFDDYPMIDGIDGYTRAGHWGLVSANGCQNIAINGRGTIDARGEFWWKSGKSDLVRPRTISLINCTDISISDITIRNSPCWTVHPICCENVTIDGISIFNPYTSPNTDGINPESCKNVCISNCYIDVGDDCVTIKSGTEDDLLQKKFPCENIEVTDCTMVHGHGGVVFGSEMSGGVRNVTVKNCVFRNTDRGIRIKTRRYRGGYIKNLNISDIDMDGGIACITMNSFYACGKYSVSKEEVFDSNPKEVTELTPVISDVKISNLKCKNIKGAGIYIYGLPEMPIKNVVMKNIDFEVTGSQEALHVILVFDKGWTKGEGIFLENAENVILDDVKIKCPEEKLTVKNCSKIVLNGEDVGND